MMYDLQKASVWKRASAFLFDAILLSIAVVGFAFLVSSITGYDKKSGRLDEIYSRYEEEYSVDFDITEEEYLALSDAEKQKFDAAGEALNADGEAAKTFSLVVNLTVVIVSVSLLLGFMLLEFAVPLLLGNGQTLGKKIFGVCLVRSDGVKINSVMLLIRTLLGKYTIETMVPVLIIIMIYFRVLGIYGTIVLGLMLLLQIVVFSVSRTNSFIHDLLAGTVAADMTSQRIFVSEDELIEFKKRRAAEAAAKKEY